MSFYKKFIVFVELITLLTFFSCGIASSEENSSHLSCRTFVIRRPGNPARAGVNKDIQYKLYSKAELKKVGWNRS